jgi:hypothetical protein
VAQQAPYQVTETSFTEVTVTVAVAGPKLGVLAVIVAEPTATPVTGTVMPAELAKEVTVAGTVATLVLLELRLTVIPLAGAGARFNVRSCVEPAMIVRPNTGEKKLLPSLAVTRTWALPGVKPGADAVMLADPSLMPLTCGCVVEDVFLAAMKTLGVTVAVEVSLLASETVTPPAGAGADKVTWSATD